MERLTSYKNEWKREMLCKYEDCDIDEEHCPHVNEDNCPCLQAVLEKLAEYEDLNEQGKLLKLRCKVGDTVYEVQKIRKRIQPYEIIAIKIGRMGELYYYWKLKDDHGVYGNLKGFGDRRLNVDVFLTESKAEEALQKWVNEDKKKIF